MDLDILREKLQPAVDFSRQTGLPLYCGEYGAIDTSDLTSRIRWHRDFTTLLREHNIGKAVWSYKEMNFSMVWADGQEVSRELIEIVSTP